jgi:hypothetical protein
LGLRRGGNKPVIADMRRKACQAFGIGDGETRIPQAARGASLIAIDLELDIGDAEFCRT